MSKEATRMYSTCFSSESAGYCGLTLGRFCVTRLSLCGGTRAEAFEWIDLTEERGIDGAGWSGGAGGIEEPDEAECVEESRSWGAK